MSTNLLGQPLSQALLRQINGGTGHKANLAKLKAHKNLNENQLGTIANMENPHVQGMMCVCTLCIPLEGRF
ncbi:Hypothetical protein PMT_2712 [Prochlorococcus marinus str. MIT 9313]|uniref:Uncharacterized protein n=1 Tax=Prochlorococcus marinus (strain MIT 9313) TaxID=74547 RepID=B9ES95_PROMM|nr:hypothetical protein [Prochlorococcus marinus]CAX32234.1 Hypothetical protein PMT_2712 [Prochlorococcus marinus str. MIT 9313]